VLSDAGQDSGGNAGTLVFSHANGFPAGTYRLLFEAWRAAGWRVLAVPQFGHDPRYPVTSNWPRLRQQLIDFIQAQAPGERVHLVGHSLGGFLSLMVAGQAPALARSVVMIDSPVVAGWRAHSLHVAKVTGLVKRVTPGKVSQRRRWQWPSAPAALAHFAGKHSFARWEPQVLQDYIACGTVPDPQPGQPDAVRLAFSREVETRLYNTLPHNMAPFLRRHPPRCPVGFIGGTQSAELRQAGLAATRVLTQGRILWLEGSHLVPMERPLATAQAVLELLGP
jgi:pimeloyl-ACP methyl ester carboxylesterase